MVPVRQRASSRVALGVEARGRESLVRTVSEAGSARVRFPTTRDGLPEAVLINTGGGLAGGDRLDIRATLGPDSRLVVTSAAAEKVYRAQGEPVRIDNRLVVEAGARLDWLPQETILFDRARLLRSLEVDVHPDGTALLLEASVFGRAAMGEAVREGAFRERWRVRRGGRLVYADTLRLEGPIDALLSRPGVAGGCRALASALYVAPDAQARLDEARGHLAPSRSECGASAWNGCLAIRWLAPDIATLRAHVAAFMTAFRRRPLPRVWHL